jgi:hypothetical protein
MPTRFAKFTQSDAKRLFKAAASAGVKVRVEFRPDGTIIAIADRPPSSDGEPPSESPEDISSSSQTRSAFQGAAACRISPERKGIG